MINNVTKVDLHPSVPTNANTILNEGAGVYVNNLDEDSYDDYDNYDEDWEESFFIQNALNCKCGAWVFNLNRTTFHVADCCC